MSIETTNSNCGVAKTIAYSSQSRRNQIVSMPKNKHPGPKFYESLGQDPPEL